MSLSAAVIRELVAAGLSGEALVAACERIEGANGPVNKPRSAGAIRQERYMNRKRGSVSNDVTSVTVTDDDVGFPTPLPNLSLELPKTPLKGVKKVSPVTVPMRRKALVPRDWTPSDENRADAIKAGLAERDIAGEAQRFIDGSHSQGRTYRDFDAAWRNWCRRAVDWRPAAKSTDPPKRVWGSV